VNREDHIRAGERILRAALTAVPFFWNQLAVLHNEQERDFITEPGLIEMRRKAALQIDRMAEAVERHTPCAQIGADEMADTYLLSSARYGEYARDTIAAHEELQAQVCALLPRR
jgi:hypothetical protein